MKLALLAGTGIYIAAQAAAPALGELGPYAQLGAVGVLAWVAVALLGELRAARADSAKQREEQAAVIERQLARWDSWEQIRHDDATAMQATLREITANCAKAQAVIGKSA